MTKRMHPNPLLTSAIVLACGLYAPSAESQGSLAKLKAAIRNVRTSRTLMDRTKAAQNIANLTEEIDPNMVDDQTLEHLIALLDTTEDSVRAWIAGSIGNLGPRAKAAAPKLLKILSEADQLPGSLTSAPAIRVALTRIGVPPPAPPGEIPRI